jgi:hypothetical protein
VLPRAQLFAGICEGGLGVIEGVSLGGEITRSAVHLVCEALELMRLLLRIAGGVLRHMLCLPAQAELTLTPMHTSKCADASDLKQQGICNEQMQMRLTSSSKEPAMSSNVPSESQQCQVDDVPQRALSGAALVAQRCKPRRRLGALVFQAGCLFAARCADVLQLDHLCARRRRSARLLRGSLGSLLLALAPRKRVDSRCLHHTKLRVYLKHAMHSDKASNWIRLHTKLSKSTCMKCCTCIAGKQSMGSTW